MSDGGTIIRVGEKKLRKKLVQLHFVHYESHIKLSGVDNNINTNSGTDA
jgi:hypothetical protein